MCAVRRSDDLRTQRANDDHRLVALISYPDGADPEALTRDFMASPEFAADMEGFDAEDLVALDAFLLDCVKPPHVS